MKGSDVAGTICPWLLLWSGAVEPVRLVLKVKPLRPLTLPLPCVLPGVENGKPTHFTVYTKGAGKAPLNVQFSSLLPGDAVKDLDIIDNYDYSHTVKYTPTQQVSFLLAPCFSGQAFPSQCCVVLCCAMHSMGMISACGDATQCVLSRRKNPRGCYGLPREVGRQPHISTSVWGLIREALSSYIKNLPSLPSYAQAHPHPIPLLSRSD